LPDGYAEASAEQYQEYNTYKPGIIVFKQEPEPNANYQYWPEAPQFSPQTPRKNTKVLQ
jgi:hypothetical protein